MASRGQAPDARFGGLMALLIRFKDARRRRDQASYGSRPWLDADDELATLQREIFAATAEPSNGSKVGSPGAAKESDPDHELAPPEGRTAF
jgi:hypothetical protein